MLLWFFDPSVRFWLNSAEPPELNKICRTANDKQTDGIMANALTTHPTHLSEYIHL